jgi:hypothetical protein
MLGAQINVDKLLIITDCENVSHYLREQNLTIFFILRVSFLSGLRNSFVFTELSCPALCSQHVDNFKM